jgi:AcrR family transcriptional regulator
MPEPALSPRLRRRGPKQPLSRAAVVAAALDCLQEGGPAGLTMRGVAARLETGPSSLYTFVRDQRELHVLVLDSVAATVSESHDSVVGLLLDYARRLHAFPGSARLALLTPPTGPAFLDLLEQAMRLLVAEGLPIGSAERACDALVLLVTANVAEQEGRTGDRSIPELYDDALDADATSRPHLAAAREAMRSPNGEGRLEWSLRAYLAGAKGMR